MLECRQCGLYSSSRKPLPEVLDEYYATFYSDPDDQVTLTNKNKFARHIFHYAAAVAPSERLCVLDFGGGDGTLALLIARVALESGYDAVDVQLVDYTKPATSPDALIRWPKLDSLAVIAPRSATV